MDLRLSWDLFVIVFFAIVVAYSFIIGRTSTLKIILATYVGTLCADGVGNILERVLGTTEFFTKLMNFIGFSGGIDQMSSIFKILLFIGVIVILTIWGDYIVEEPRGENPLISISILILISVLSGGLILSSIIVFANGGSLIEGTTALSDGFIQVYNESRMVKNLLDWHDAWFAAPGVVFVLISIFQKNSHPTPS